MPYDLQVLKREYVDYQKSQLISESQIQLINKIYDNYCKNTTTPEKLLDLINKLLGKNLENLNRLNCSEVKKIISYFNNNLLALSDYRRDKMSNLNLDKLSIFLDKKITSLTDITRMDYYKINNSPEYNFINSLKMFNLKTHDYIIESKIDYEYGYQTSELCEMNRLYYIKFYEFLVLDYDNIRLSEIEDLLKCYFTDTKGVCFHIYKTYRGYHLYLMSDTMSHDCLITSYLMKALKCDLWYILFSYRNGFKIRLSKKKDRNEANIETFVKSWGTAKIHNKCQEYRNIIDYFM